MRIAIVNVASGSWYPKGQERLLQSLHDVGWTGDVLTWRDQLPPGARAHDDVPYGFKFWAMHAARVNGYDVALWLDASFWAIRALGPLMQLLERYGQAFWLSGYSTGQWCSDAALDRLRITREEAFETPLLAGGIFALDFRARASRAFLDEALPLAAEGSAFRGAWTNTNREVSSHPQVLGHRHDMPVISVLARRFRFPTFTPLPLWALWADPPPPGAVLLARGL